MWRGLRRLGRGTAPYTMVQQLLFVRLASL